MANDGKQDAIFKKATAVFLDLAGNKKLALKLAREIRSEVLRSQLRRYIVWSARTGFILSFDRVGLPYFELIKCETNSALGTADGLLSERDLADFIRRSAAETAGLIHRTAAEAANEGVPTDETPLTSGYWRRLGHGPDEASMLAEASGNDAVPGGVHFAGGRWRTNFAD